jgi:phenylacetate-coenzyme A ligase PaaK-like adenylate-forming protein
MTAFARFRDRLQTALLARLDEHIARLSWDASRIRTEQRTRLRKLLAHASAHSPFHRARLAGIDPDRFELDDLASLPVMTKADMMDRLDDVFTDRALTPDAVERALAATAAEPVLIDDRFIAMTSGGSSGRRGVFVLDRDGLVDYLGCLCRSLVARLRAQGGPPPGGLPIAFVAAASAVHATGAAVALAVGGQLPFRFCGVPVTLRLDEITARLDAIDAPALYGYPSMLARLADEKRAGRLRIAPRLITTTSETLTPALRESITDAFAAPIVDVFGSTEGLVGATPPGEPIHAFNTDTCIIELVDRDHRPVPDGEVSDSILITNLSNLVQPLIRYELTDRFTRQPPAVEHGHLRATVEGRTDDVLRYADIAIHPLVVHSVLVTVPAVLDYQIRQTPRGVEIVTVAADAIDPEHLVRRLSQALAAAGLVDPEVQIRRQAALERDALTGKVRRLVPLPASR